MARWALLAKSYIADQLLPVGTVFGDGTPYPYSGGPAPHFAPLDDEARAQLAAYYAPPPVPPPSPQGDMARLHPWHPQ